MRYLQALTWILALGCIQMASAGDIKCWQNNEGVTECGTAVPPAYVPHGHREFNDQGMVVKRVGRAKTEQEIAEEQRLRKLEEERERAARERANRDRILLDTFSTEEEIVMTRDGKIALIDTEIKIARRNIEITKTHMESLRKTAANMERRGRPVSAELNSDMRNAKSQIAQYNEFVTAKLAEQKAIRKAYDADLKRFRELQSRTSPRSQKQALSQ